MNVVGIMEPEKEEKEKEEKRGSYSLSIIKRK